MKGGRSKIPIKRITNEKARQSTFLKRKSGLIKKAMELSILCECEIALTLISHNKKVFQYSSLPLEVFLRRYEEVCPSNLRVLDNTDYEKLFGSERVDIEGDFREGGNSLIPPLPHFVRSSDRQTQTFHENSQEKTLSQQKDSLLPPSSHPVSHPLPLSHPLPTSLSSHPHSSFPPSQEMTSLARERPTSEETTFVEPTNRSADERLEKKRKRLNIFIPSHDSSASKPHFSRPLSSSSSSSSSQLNLNFESPTPSLSSSSSSSSSSSLPKDISTPSFFTPSTDDTLDNNNAFPFSPLALTPGVFSHSFLIPNTPFELNTPSLRSGWWMPSPLHPQYWDRSKSPPNGNESETKSSESDCVNIDES